MIKRLVIKNFKSVKNLELECSRINVFIGYANSGKSNILEAIGLLSYLGFNGDPKKFLRTNTARDLFHDRDLTSELKIEVNEVSVIGRGRRGIIDWRIKFNNYFRSVMQLPNTRPFQSEGSIPYFKTFRFYRFSSIGVNNTPTEFLLPPDGPNLLGVLNSKRELRELIETFFSEFGHKIILKPREKRIDVINIRDGVRIATGLDTISETVLRTIFYYAIVMSNKNAVIAFEEPETHLAPFNIKMLAREISLDKSNQYFISTHNPYFLTTLINEAADTSFKVFLTMYKNYETVVYPVEIGKIREFLGKGIDVFFNLEKLLQ